MPLHACLQASGNATLGGNQAADLLSAGTMAVPVIPPPPSACSMPVVLESSCLSPSCRLPKEQQCLVLHEPSSPSAKLTGHTLFSEQNDLFSFISGIPIKHRFRFHFPVFV